MRSLEKRMVQTILGRMVSRTAGDPSWIGLLCLVLLSQFLEQLQEIALLTAHQYVQWQIDNDIFPKSQVMLREGLHQGQQHIQDAVLGARGGRIGEVLEHVLDDVLCLLQDMASELLSEVVVQLGNDLLILGVLLVVGDEVGTPEHHEQGVQEVAGSCQHLGLGRDQALLGDEDQQSVEVHRVDDDVCVVVHQPGVHPQEVIHQVGESVDAVRTVQVAEGNAREGLVDRLQQVKTLLRLRKHCYGDLDQVDVGTDGVLVECLVHSPEERRHELLEGWAQESHDVLEDAGDAFDLGVLVLALAAGVLQCLNEELPGIVQVFFEDQHRVVEFVPFQGLEDLAETLQTVLLLLVCTELINTDLVKAQQEVRNVVVGCGLIRAGNRNEPSLDVLIFQVTHGQVFQIFDVLMEQFGVLEAASAEGPSGDVEEKRLVQVLGDEGDEFPGQLRVLSLNPEHTLEQPQESAVDDDGDLPVLLSLDQLLIQSDEHDDVLVDCLKDIQGNVQGIEIDLQFSKEALTAIVRLGDEVHQVVQVDLDAQQLGDLFEAGHRVNPVAVDLIGLLVVIGQLVLLEDVESVDQDGWVSADIQQCSQDGQGDLHPEVVGHGLAFEGVEDAAEEVAGEIQEIVDHIFQIGVEELDEGQDQHFPELWGVGSQQGLDELAAEGDHQLHLLTCHVQLPLEQTLIDDEDEFRHQLQQVEVDAAVVTRVAQALGHHLQTLSRLLVVHRVPDQLDNESEQLELMEAVEDFLVVLDVDPTGEAVDDGLLVEVRDEPHGLGLLVEGHDDLQLGLGQLAPGVLAVEGVHDYSGASDVGHTVVQDLEIILSQLDGMLDCLAEAEVLLHVEGLSAQTVDEDDGQTLRDVVEDASVFDSHVLGHMDEPVVVHLQFVGVDALVAVLELVLEHAAQQGDLLPAEGQLLIGGEHEHGHLEEVLPFAGEADLPGHEGGLLDVPALLEVDGEEAVDLFDLRLHCQSD